MSQLPPAARLISKKSCFIQGTCYADFVGTPSGPRSAAMYDCLGAILAAYEGHPVENRHLAAKRAFDLCRARHGHSRLGQLDWEQSLELLTDANT